MRQFDLLRVMRSPRQDKRRRQRTRAGISRREWLARVGRLGLTIPFSFLACGKNEPGGHGADEKRASAPNPTPSRPAAATDPDPCHHRFERQRVVPVPSGGDSRDRSAAPVRGEVNLARQPAAGAPQALPRIAPARTSSAPWPFPSHGWPHLTSRSPSRSASSSKTGPSSTPSSGMPSRSIRTRFPNRGSLISRCSGVPAGS